jgi:hypothetical protein
VRFSFLRNVLAVVLFLPPVWGELYFYVFNVGQANFIIAKAGENALIIDAGAETKGEENPTDSDLKQLLKNKQQPA